MNIEAYNLDSLRKLVRALQAENKELRELLEKAEIPYSNSEVFVDTPVRKEEFDLDQGEESRSSLLTRSLRSAFSLCFGEERMYLPKGQGMAITIPNVITVGIMHYVPNKRVRRLIVETASMLAGLN